MHYQRAETKACVHQNPGTPHSRGRRGQGAGSAFVCLSVSCRGGIGRQWPATWTGALAAADLGGAAYEPQHRATEQTAQKQEATNKTLCTPGPRRKEQWLLTRDWAELACECPGVSGRGMGEQWLPWGQEHWTQQSWHKPFWSRSPLPLPLPPLQGREHSTTLQQKIGLKIYWAWPHLSEQDPDSATASPSHQEASTSLLSLLIRGHTECIPQSHKTNQTDHMDHRLV